MQRRLGQSEITLSAVGLGLVDFAAGPGWLSRALFPPLDQPAKTAVVAAALGAGIDWFDTAEMYGFGASERALAVALRSLNVAPEAVTVATKWFPLGRTASHLGRSIGARCKALEPYPIGLYMVHHPFGFSTAIAEMRAMASLARRGLIHSIGVSNFSAAAMRRAHRTLAALGLPLAVNQVRFNLLDRRLETNGVLATAQELGISLIAYSPLAKGLLSGRYHREPALLARQGLRRRLMMPQNLRRTAPLIAALDAVAAAHGASAAQVALAWVLQRHGALMLAAVGATRPQQASAAAAAMAISLSANEMALLTERSDYALA